MKEEQLKMIIENEREWRQYIVEKVDSIEKELHTFKIKVFGFATVFGGGAGLSVDFLKNFFN